MTSSHDELSDTVVRSLGNKFDIMGLTWESPTLAVGGSKRATLRSDKKIHEG